jgi:hypothetical protein
LGSHRDAHNIITLRLKDEYFKEQLRARIHRTVDFDINHLDSKDSGGLQAVDMFSYGIFEAYERERWDWHHVFKDNIAFETVYFKQKK